MTASIHAADTDAAHDPAAAPIVDAGALLPPPASAAESQIDYVDSCDLPTPWATFRLHGFIDRASGKEHVAVTLGDLDGGAPVLARVHSECLTGDALFSQRCDCGAQLEESLRRIAAEGRGIVLYLRQEGRGIGLMNKIRAYHLQDAGADTVEANESLGFAADQRHYGLCEPMLAHFGIVALRLMTNNPAKVVALQKLGITIPERLPILVGHNPTNQRYLSTKREKLGHVIGLPPE